MAGASPEHNQVTGNLAAALHGPMTARGCRLGIGDQRVRTVAGRYSYPDLVFTCGGPRYTDDTPAGDGEANPPVLLNPTLVVEVVSPSPRSAATGARSSGRTPVSGVWSSTGS